MSDSTIPVSNTPIFDQMKAEFAARGKHYESMVARPVLVNPWPKTLKGARPAGEIVDEVPVVSQYTSVLDYGPDFDGGSSLVRPIPLWAQMARKGVDIRKSSVSIPNVGVSTEEALKGMQRIADVSILTMERPAVVLERGEHHPQDGEVVLYEDNVHPLDLEKAGYNTSSYMGRILRQLEAENSGNVPKSIQIREELDGTMSLIVRGDKVVVQTDSGRKYYGVVQDVKELEDGSTSFSIEPKSIGENEAESLYMKLPGFWADDKE